MLLFHPKTLHPKLSQYFDKDLGQYKEIPAQHLKIINNWNDAINNGSLAKQGEKSAHPTFIKQILVGLLGYKASDNSQQWTADYETRIGKGNVDVALGACPRTVSLLRKS